MQCGRLLVSWRERATTPKSNALRDQQRSQGRLEKHGRARLCETLPVFRSQPDKNRFTLRTIGGQTITARESTLIACVWSMLCASIAYRNGMSSIVLVTREIIDNVASGSNTCVALNIVVAKVLSNRLSGATA